MGEAWADPLLQNAKLRGDQTDYGEYNLIGLEYLASRSASDTSPIRSGVDLNPSAFVHASEAKARWPDSALERASDGEVLGRLALHADQADLGAGATL